MPGRKPHPNKLKLLKGYTRPDRLRENVPEPPEGAIVRPGYLKDREAQLWDEWAPALIAMGTLTVADVSVFATWCVLEAEFERLGTKMQTSQIAQKRLYGSDLGMGAGSRAKLGTGKGRKKAAEDEFFETA